MLIVRQSTAFETAIGPILDADGVAVTDGVVGDFKLKKTTGNFAALNGSATLTHVSAGMYDLVLTTSDVDTVGVCCVAIDDTTNACAPLYLQVIEEAVYDALFAASAPGYLQPTTAGRTLTIESDGMAHADVKEWLGVAPLALSSQQIQAVVPTTQKVDVETIKTQSVTLSGGVTIPAATLASTTNITGGTITTVTNLTNAPTAGDLTATMKASVNAEVDTALSDYDPPTRAELTSDINSVLARLRWVVIVDGTIGATGNDTTHVHLPGLTYGNDEINGYMLVVYDVSEDEYHWRKITDWVLATELATVDALPFTPQNSTDTYALLASLADASVTGGDATAANQATIIGLLGTPADLGSGATVGDNLTDIAGSGFVSATDGLAANQVEHDATQSELAKVPKSDSNVTWNATAAAQIQSEATDALNAYDPPTNTEMVAAFTEIKGATWATTDTLEAIRDRGDAAWITATGFSTHSAADVWASGTRTLTAGTNIQLPSNGLALVTAWTVDITGSLSGSVGSVTGAVGSVTGAVGSVTGNVGGNVAGSVASVTGAVGSVTAAVTVGTNNDKTGYVLSAVGSAALTEGYAADGATATLNQILYMIYSAVMEFSISGTTLTCKKLDGSTTAMTVTLDDSSNPTSRTRSG